MFGTKLRFQKVRVAIEFEVNRDFRWGWIAFYERDSSALHGASRSENAIHRKVVKMMLQKP